MGTDLEPHSMTKLNSVRFILQSRQMFSPLTTSPAHQGLDGPLCDKNDMTARGRLTCCPSPTDISDLTSELSQAPPSHVPPPPLKGQRSPEDSQTDSPV